MSARRCSPCGLNWPMEGYWRCGKCEGPLNVLQAAEPLSVDQAASIKNHADFERYCEAETPEDRAARLAKWDAEREASRAAFEAVVASLDRP